MNIASGVQYRPRTVRERRVVVTGRITLCILLMSITVTNVAATPPLAVIVLIFFNFGVCRLICFHDTGFVTVGGQVDTRVRSYGSLGSRVRRLGDARVNTSVAHQKRSSCRSGDG